MEIKDGDDEFSILLQTLRISLSSPFMTRLRTGSLSYLWFHEILCETQRDGVVFIHRPAQQNLVTLFRVNNIIGQLFLRVFVPVCVSFIRFMKNVKRRSRMILGFSIAQETN